MRLYVHKHIQDYKLLESRYLFNCNLLKYILHLVDLALDKNCEIIEYFKFLLSKSFFILCV